MPDLMDARPLRLMGRFLVAPRMCAMSIYWHEVDSRPCLCDTIHGHCFAVACPCGQHEGEIGAR